MNTYQQQPQQMMRMLCTSLMHRRLHLSRGILSAIGGSARCGMQSGTMSRQQKPTPLCWLTAFLSRLPWKKLCSRLKQLTGSKQWINSNSCSSSNNDNRSPRNQQNIPHMAEVLLALGSNDMIHYNMSHRDKYRCNRLHANSRNPNSRGLPSRGLSSRFTNLRCLSSKLLNSRGSNNGVH